MVRLTVEQHRSELRIMTSPNDLARLLAGSGPILLDFDGPVCKVFAGYPPTEVADELRTLLHDKGTDLPEAVRRESDPLEILRWAGGLDVPEMTRAVEDALRAAELRAVRSAAPTPYARETIVAARQAGKPVAIVSNNSDAAINEYLTLHRLARHVGPVVGRPYAEPHRMKPNPEPIWHAMRLLNTNPRSAVLVGDSLSDIAAARAIEMPVIAYANKPHKVAPFLEADPDAVVTSMIDIARALIPPASIDEVGSPFDNPAGRADAELI